ncbi:MAG: dipeptide epimerase [Hyphomicrobiaceae bacterium]|nr:dipeptide epimerase [Hyphomicrobiaceae bacterium]
MDELQLRPALITLRSARIERWPLAGTFRISRGAKTEAAVVVVQLSRGSSLGRGEATPYARYGETADRVLADIRRAARSLPAHPKDARRALMLRLAPGAARNALDCALWDLEAKLTGRHCWQLAALPSPAAAVTCYTLSLDTPEAMAAAARAHAHLPVLKLKLGADGDDERMCAVREARPDARIVIDANEGWKPATLSALIETAAKCGVELIEQPLPANDDAVLADADWPVCLCADESAAPGIPLAALANRYGAINVKLDKAGGLTSAIQLVAEARSRGLDVMLGSMVATSLAMAPAMLLASQVRWVDLDSPLLLARDRPNGLAVHEGTLSPPTPALWG